MAKDFALRQHLWNLGLLGELWMESELHQNNSKSVDPEHNVDKAIVERAQHVRNVANSLLPTKPTAEQIKDLLIR